MAKKRKPKVVQVGRKPIIPIGAKKRTAINKKISAHYERLRKRYPEVHGKVVDFINHAIKDGTLYFTVRFQDKTMFSLHYRCDMFAVGADISDVETGNFEIIREYRRPKE